MLLLLQLREAQQWPRQRLAARLRRTLGRQRQAPAGRQAQVLKGPLLRRRRLARRRWLAHRKRPAQLKAQLPRHRAPGTPV
jgi:hypothetical protein